MRCFVRRLLLAALAAGSVAIFSASRSSAQQAAPTLSPEARARLLVAAGDKRLPPWQRDVMLEVAGDSTATDTTVPRGPAAVGDGVWQRLGPPNARYLHAAVYDPLRDRMLVFGGYSKEDYLTNDVWALSLGPTPAWTLLDPTGMRPSPRHLTSAIYDPVRDRLVVFGGQEGSATAYLGDVWALSLAETPAWSQVVPVGVGPSSRARHSAVYDPVRDRMIVFGGYHAGYRGAGAGPLNDVWALSLSDAPTWTPIAPIGSGPSARYGQSAVYDPTRDRVLVFGGFGQTYLNDVWSLSLRGKPHWFALAPTGSLPAPRLEHSAIFDEGGDRMVIFGGSAPGGADGAWSLSFHGRETWARLNSASEPSVRSGHSTIYDPARARMVVYGGTPDGFGLFSEIWAMSLSGATTWTRLVTPDPPTGLSSGFSTIYDPVRERMLLFGGYGGGFFNDVWELSLAGDPAWTMLHPAGPAPSPRADHGAIYDPVRDRMIVFGGEVRATPEFTNDVWALSLSGELAWTRLAPAGNAPVARSLHSAIYDAANDRMVIFGGVNATSYLGDTWALSLSTPPTWIPLAPVGASPGLRFEHSAIYDPVRERMVLFAGLSPLLLFKNDVWALSLTDPPAWTLLTPTGTAPPIRAGHGAIYDSARDRMVVFGGFSYSGSGPGRDPWALSFEPAVWTKLQPAGTPPGGGPGAIYDVAGDRMLVFSGSELRELRWSTSAFVAGVSAAAPVQTATPHVSPNPSRGDVTISFTSAQPTEAIIRIYDLAGRTVRTLATGTAAAGSRSIQWDRRTSAGVLAQPGLYFCEVRANGRSEMRRFVLIH